MCFDSILNLKKEKEFTSKSNNKLLQVNLSKILLEAIKIYLAEARVEEIKCGLFLIVTKRKLFAMPCKKNTILCA